MSIYDDLKIEIFPDINDIDIAPSPERASNGSHLIAKFNQLVDTIEALKNRIQTLENNSSDTSVEDTSTPLNFPFFIESGGGSTWVGEAPTTGTITKYFIDNIDISTIMNLTLNGNYLIHNSKVNIGSGVEYLFDYGTAINSGDEIGLFYSGITEEINSTVTLYIQE